LESDRIHRVHTELEWVLESVPLSGLALVSELVSDLVSQLGLELPLELRLVTELASALR
jgi:hypothetical protein